MFIAVFPLIRDQATRGQNFGYKRSLWDKRYLPYQHHEPDIGSPIEQETKLVLKIAKIIELHRDNDNSVIERLAWIFGDKLYPFRLKQIDKGGDITKRKDPVLFLSNLEQIHRKLTGNDVSFVSPLRFYIDMMSHDPTVDRSAIDYALGVCENYESVTGTVTQETDSGLLKDFLAGLDAGHPSGIKWLLSQSDTTDYISRRTHSQHINTRDVVSLIEKGRLYDTTEPEPLEIKHPEVTLFSPVWAHRITELCEFISSQYSDINFRYILQDGYITDRKVVRFVSRFVSAPNEAIVRHYIEWIFIDSWSLARERCKNIPHNLMVTIQITYGDEALIEFYSTDNNRCIFAIHLDLAMISLCSSGIIAATP